MNNDETITFLVEVNTGSVYIMWCPDIWGMIDKFVAKCWGRSNVQRVNNFCGSSVWGDWKSQVSAVWENRQHWAQSSTCSASMAHHPGCTGTCLYLQHGEEVVTGRGSVDDDPCPGGPLTSSTQGTIYKGGICALYIQHSVAGDEVE